MTPLPPRIGFDYFIPLEWAVAALRARAEVGSLNDLNMLLDDANLGVAVRKKAQTVLNRLWLEPHSELSDLALRGSEIFKADQSIPASVLTWGMAISTYPFFGKTAELIGRLLSIQGECSSNEIHRRMSEIYGERDGIRRAANRVIQSQASWGAIERVDNGKRLVQKDSIVVSNDQAVAWLIEAALRYVGKAVPIPTLSSLTVLYPFVLDQPIAYLASKSPNLEVRSEGSGSQFVVLKEIK